MTKQSRPSNNKQSFERASSKPKQAAHHVKPPIKQPQQHSKQAINANQLQKSPSFSGTSSSHGVASRGSSARVTRPSKTSHHDTELNSGKQNKQTRKAIPVTDVSKRAPPKSPKAKPEATAVSDKWSGSTFHSSPNAASSPRPPFARTSPPLANQQLNQSPAVPPPFEQLNSGTPVQRQFQQPAGFPTVGPQVTPQPQQPNGPMGFNQTSSPFMHCPPAPAQAAAPYPMFNNTMMPQGYMASGMPVGFRGPHCGMSNHPMAFNPMFLAPPIMPMPHSGKAEH